MPSITEVTLEIGEILYSQGDPNDSAYVVESGEILLFSHTDGVRQNCERRGAGCILGETSILTDQPRAVSVEALTPCRLFRISTEEILKKFEELDPVLKSCVDTAINFVSRFYRGEDKDEPEVPLVPSTLRNADVLIEKFKFELDVKNAIENQEFFMAYQPIVLLETGKIAGFEALMRWNHLNNGPIRPDLFIHAAEQMGAIGKLTDFALMQACETLKNINSHFDEPLFASVNVSGQDIDRAGFPDFIEHVLDVFELQPDSLKLEVTETALVPDSDCATENLEALRRLGCGISIDDFGTGYSNLAYLKSLPLTALKIDRAFAGDAVNNAVSRTIVRMLVALGNELCVDVIAEGVETSEDVSVLCSLGCKFAQGFYFHKPMPETDLLELVTPFGKSNLSVA